MTPLLSSTLSFNSIAAISCRSVLLFGETGVLGEDHRPVAIHWRHLSYKVVSSTSLQSTINRVNGCLRGTHHLWCTARSVDFWLSLNVIRKLRHVLYCTTERAVHHKLCVPYKQPLTLLILFCYFLLENGILCCELGI
jgi:hypothetical protein